MLVIFVCGHHIGTEQGLPLFEQSIRLVDMTCLNPGCRSIGAISFRQQELGLETCDILCDHRQRLAELTHGVTGLLRFSTTLPNRLRMEDFYAFPEQERRLGKAFVRAQTQPFDAVFELFPQLEWAQEVLVDEACTVFRQGGAAGFVHGMERILQLIIRNVEHNSHLIAQTVSNIARMQQSGAWELETYDPKLGVEDLALLRRAGRIGAKALAAPISPHNVVTACALIEALKKLKSTRPELAASTETRVQDAVQLDVDQTSQSKAPYSAARYRARMKKVLAQKRLQWLRTDLANAWGTW